MMQRQKTKSMLIGGGVGFVLAILIVTVGLLNTIFIAIVTLIAAGLGYLVEKYEIDFSRISELVTRKNQR
ncbi:DUF2273 domain-containing protein [Leuconostoc carnosum]|uniref:DUF2273 domain-containing protein n=1 Tax=Leuconostoc carnosum TaxID=1252 RepID=UPI001CC232D5|nr:DUF2273 domain-containing protein [Leuconostoc carnosum]